MIYITAIHLVGGEGHEHIASVRWQTPANDKSGENTRAEMVVWINEGGQAYVSQGGNTAQVGVVNANPPYIRTYADGKWNDNLLALPQY